ncbi:MAG: hypothetical protein PF795_15465 [Kiritimatiellae bacterium]|jgi:hypothetical protein|nr:hypothetical protein [Kiritimatiellia bacterium]
MSVVSTEWRDPAEWAPAKRGIGVVLDGESLRVARTGKSGKIECSTCSRLEWDEGAECRQRFERDVQSGARVAAGLQAHRFLLRNLESPLTDASKSAEIWAALLDAAIPFPLETCQVVFLPPQPGPDGGLRCLAVAARQQDVREALDEWAEWGIDPDLLLPEPLMLPRASGCPIWLGNNRSVFVAWNGDTFLGTAATLKRDQREKTLNRFQQAWKEALPEVEWVTMGPEGESNNPEVLETALCRACMETSKMHANVREGSLATDTLRTIHRKRRGILKGSAIFLLLLLAVWPLGLRYQLRRKHEHLRREISDTFTDFTGYAAPGEEVLLAQRHLEGEWMERWEVANRLLSPEVSDRYANISRLVEQRELVLSRMRVDQNSIELNVLGEEVQTISLVKNLGLAEGWTVKYAPEANGTWKISGSMVR